MNLLTKNTEQQEQAKPLEISSFNSKLCRFADAVPIVVAFPKKVNSLLV